MKFFSRHFVHLRKKEDGSLYSGRVGGIYICVDWHRKVRKKRKRRQRPPVTRYTRTHESPTIYRRLENAQNIFSSFSEKQQHTAKDLAHFAVLSFFLQISSSNKSFAFMIEWPERQSYRSFIQPHKKKTLLFFK